jgi:uncharacterized protein (TIGR02453 family)
MHIHNLFQFLIDLECNNNRPWFNDNKQRYLEAKETFDEIVERLILSIRQFDKEVDVQSAKDCVFRIYRDSRFSKDKTPYKTHFGAFISKGGRKSPYGGYYFHFQPDGSFVGGGIYKPESSILKSIRQHIYDKSESYKDIIEDVEFKYRYPTIYGDPLKMTPKGFAKDWKDIDLIKNRHYTVTHQLPNEFWFQEDFIQKLLDHFHLQMPFIHFLNEAVSHSVSEKS